LVLPKAGTGNLLKIFEKPEFDPDKIEGDPAGQDMKSYKYT